MRVSSWLLFVGGWWLVVRDPINRVCTLVVNSCLILPTLLTLLTPLTPLTLHPTGSRLRVYTPLTPLTLPTLPTSPSPYSRNTSGLIRLLQEVESSSHK
ncbi:hypothetical protein [Fischerella thermalis]|uniref:hypothetical protein n=1 Tax=Fischerella thermalis TaxID=372787 RepID=UPI00030FC052|nr:hypothetical protein [Fischerella thermalis]